jgi:hypothetical protein
VDPIHPIAPGPPAVPPGGTRPVERLERISRERDRPPKDRQRRDRREPAGRESADGESSDEDEGRPHVDVRA